MNTVVVKHSVVIGGHKTSVSLEQVFWNEVKRIAGEARLSISQYVESIDAKRGLSNLSSALRLAVIADLQAQLVRKQQSTQAA